MKIVRFLRVNLIIIITYVFLILLNTIQYSVFLSRSLADLSTMEIRSLRDIQAVQLNILRLKRDLQNPLLYLLAVKNILGEIPTMAVDIDSIAKDIKEDKTRDFCHKILKEIGYFKKQMDIIVTELQTSKSIPGQKITEAVNTLGTINDHLEVLRKQFTVNISLQYIEWQRLIQHKTLEFGLIIVGLSIVYLFVQIISNYRYLKLSLKTKITRKNRRI